MSENEPEECPEQETQACDGCCCGAGENEEPEKGENETEDLESEDFEEPEEAEPEEENQEKLTVTTSMDLQGSHFLYTQATEKSLKTLDYDYKRCNGCGICVDICPTKALELGPMHEIATGLDAPPVMMDLDKCTFCRMCSNLCPVHAITLESLGDVPDKKQYPKYDAFVNINEKCLPCALCEGACPQDAIEVEFTFPKKEEIAPFKEGAEGEIEIDPDKCNFCGICARFCDAFILLEREPTPDNPVPFEQLLVDEDKCDYCVLCQDLCPEEAIKVKGERPCEAPKVEGKVTVDDMKCTQCARCQAVCPYEAVDLQKPMEGKLSLIELNLKECDPQGCRGCFNVCPSELWYVPTDPKDPRKIAFAEDFCMYCGACVKACHLGAIKVERTDVHHTEIPDTPWASQWKDAIESLKTGVRKGVDRAVFRETETLKAQKFMGIELPCTDEEALAAVQEKIDSLMPVLKSAKVRKLWETDSPESTAVAVKKKIEG
ncbi:Polyferredoxin protein MvhB [Methanosarcina siciliae T4/M]|uniref:Polyferredoxin protein MvhB n=2 Tax=Methanosarcina siciliae TaxID=38027 RepID=A0A0E3PGQ2_9EURY|nr:4Fe-4S dicluster domain-containing protein [Methanosarcina siciliae]AKB29276.1 Polyferredoxin protein MvhB [Methanosarcina siciliae T4/M]AKB33203.1 Polyferredoxin protein MvhB [Methanosarcina siciliae HI350]